MVVAVGRHGSGGPWEARYGYSRVVVAGDHAWVAGCTATVDGQVVHLGDPHAQALAAFAAAVAALESVGLATQDVVRTRMFVLRSEDIDAVGRAHAETFGATPPAATAIVVAGLVDPGMLVEVEVEAYRAAGGQ
jgi:enamine deaminase RidA (YjgF/YER057c/UK114 family)